MEPAVFRLEALFEEYEHVPDMLVLGSSDARARTIDELLQMSGETLPLDLRLGYTEARGETRLRDAIAVWHGCARENVLVTVGANEAIFLVLHTILASSDRALVCTPAYQSLTEMARHAGAAVETYRYPQSDLFRPRAEEIASRLRAAAAPFRCVIVNSPHNPTGRVLDEASLRAILDAAAETETRVISDEVMSGIHAPGTTPVPSVSRLSEDAIAIGSVSKSFGLGGLRVGWIVAPEEIIDSCTRWRYYTTISPPAIVQHLAAIAVEHHTRILRENETGVRANYETLRAWAADRGDWFELLPWEGGTVVLLRLNRATDDVELARRAAEGAHVFIVPCSTFDLPGYFRIGLGMIGKDFTRALDRLDSFLRSEPATAGYL